MERLNAIEPFADSREPLLKVDRATRVLVVDDDPDLVEFLGEALTLMGCTADVASNLDETLGLVRRAAYDVVMLDFNLPGTDGVELHREILRINPELANRAIFMSGTVQPDEELEYYASQNAPYLLKPLLLRDVLGAIRKLQGQDESLPGRNHRAVN